MKSADLDTIKNSFLPSEGLQGLRWGKILTSAFGLAVIPVLIGLHIRVEGWSWSLFGCAMVLTGLGILSSGVGNHRLFAHGSFQASTPLKVILLFFACSPRTYSALKWANFHRLHHKYGDDPLRDPYPITRGFFFAHMGWAMSYGHRKYSEFLCPDLIKDPWIVRQHRYYDELVIFHQFAMPLAVGFFFHAPIGGLALVGLLKTALAQHSFMCVNSLGHSFGTRPYDKTTSARDSHLLALISLGEGYHNFHHAFPRDYRLGERWYAIDPGKWLIWVAAKLGWAQDLKRVSRERIDLASVKASSAPPPPGRSHPPYYRYEERVSDETHLGSV